MVPLASMTNILGDDTRREVLGLGRLGWTPRRIQQATGVRRETASTYLKAPGRAVRPPGRWGHPAANPAKEGGRASARAPPRAPGRRAIHPPDRPTRTAPTTLTLLARAARAGPHIGTLCEAIQHRDGQRGCAASSAGVLTLVRTHGAAADVCAAALELRIADYRFVRRYLERRPAAPLTLRQVDPLIRDLTHYRDLIARKAKEEMPT